MAKIEGCFAAGRDRIGLTKLLSGNIFKGCCAMGWDSGLLYLKRCTLYAFLGEADGELG